MLLQQVRRSSESFPPAERGELQTKGARVFMGRGTVDRIQAVVDPRQKGRRSCCGATGSAASPSHPRARMQVLSQPRRSGLKDPVLLQLRS